ncbi:MAG: cell division FtsA domain-containing protein [Candidatus Dormibacteria bacterium]|jgi:cell division protein FtsA
MAPPPPDTARRQPRFHVTALDIGTQVIKALVIKKEAGEAIVLGVGRAEQGPGNLDPAVPPDLETVVEGCHAALEAAEDMAEVIPTRLVIGIGGTRVRVVSSSGSKVRGRSHERISKGELEEQVESIQRRALRDAQTRLQEEAAYRGEQLRLVHSSITAAKVDGQPVLDPLRFQGQKLELTVFNTFTTEEHIAAIEEIAQALDLELLETVAEPYAVARLAATPEVLERGGIFIDIGARTTTVTMVRGGVLESARMFELGGRAFTRKLAHDLSLPLPLAESLKVRHSAGMLRGDEQARVRRAMGESAEVLAQGVALVLHELALAQPLPALVWLCGGGSLLPEILEQLSVLRWTDYLPFLQQPRFLRLTPEDLSAVHDTTGLLTSAADITPMGLAYQAAAEIEAPPPAGPTWEEMLQRVTGLIRR